MKWLDLSAYDPRGHFRLVDQLNCVGRQGSLESMFSLLIHGAEGAWSTGVCTLEEDRLFKYTIPELRERFKLLTEPAIAELLRLPCIFAYEKGVDSPAKMGWIRKIRRRQRSIELTFETTMLLPEISPGKLQEIKADLDVTDNWEMSHTHWAVKDVDLARVLFDRGGIGTDQRILLSPNNLFYGRTGPNAPALPLPPSQTIGPASATAPITKPRVFLVHGRNEGVRHEVMVFLMRIGVEPIVLHERANQGRELLAKFKSEAERCDYAVVLMTDDDVGGLVGEPLRPRARQNVIFELGFFIGLLGQAKVAVLARGNVELPSDFLGVVRVMQDADWRRQLFRELRDANLGVDPNGLT